MTAYDVGSHYVMSPDSSLSTTSSSPSDHSLYQCSISAPSNVPMSVPQSQQQCKIKQEPASFGPQQQAPQQHQQQVQSTQTRQVNANLGPVNAQATVHHHRSSPIHLWEFLKELLQQVDAGCADATVIRWLDKQRGVFKIEDSVRVAKLWGKRKNKPKMNYDKLSRSIRQYYKKGIMKKTDRSQRLVYQFCSAYCH